MKSYLCFDYFLSFSALKRKPIDNIGTIAPSNKKEVRDPRFDALCGEYDEKVFKTSYKFVDVIKSKGQLISKRPFGVFKSPKKPMKFLH